MAGYQRDLLDRHASITEFITKSPSNIIPGAVIVAVPQEAVAISDADDGDGIVQLAISLTEQTFDQRLESIAQEFLRRLGVAEKESIEAGMPSTDAATDDDEEDTAAVDELPPDSYLAKLTLELQQAAYDFDGLSLERQTAVREYVEGSSKPGKILDGQHRVFGAKDVSDFDVYLPVVLVPGISTSEQVFHFYVLNNKAKPLTPTQLRATISTSLSNEEIIGLYDRFKQAGVTEAESARWTHRANTEAESPFVGLIDFGLVNNGAFIPENVAYQLVSRFVNMPRKYKLLTGKVTAWKNDPNYDYRLRLFFALWTAIKAKYPTAWAKAVQEKKGQLMSKAGMLVLQELILDRLNASMPGRASKSQPSPLEDQEELRTAVTAELYFLPEEFFTREWQEKQLDTTDRRRFLLGQMSDAITKAGVGLGHLPLFKPKAT